MFIVFAVYVNEVGNDIAAKAVDVVVNYVKRNTQLGLTVDPVTVEGNRSDSKGLLSSCNNLFYYNLYII